MRYAQLVMGPAGSGKSTYCSTLLAHGEVSHRTINVVNLDPAAEHFTYNPVADIRDLISLDDVMEDDELKFGPNGGLVFCIEYLLKNLDWLQEQLGEEEDDYLLFDCPGQIELYTHLKSIKELVNALEMWNFRVCGVFIIDSQFMVDSAKFISGSLSALSAMVNFEIPHVNVLSKMDLLGKEGRKQVDRFLEPDIQDLLSSMDSGPSKWNEKYKDLTASLGHVLDDYSLVRYVPLNINDEECIEELLIQIDSTIQYGEDLDVKIRDFDEEPEDENKE